MRRWFSSAGAALPLALFAALLAPTLAPAETCMSPFVKRLDRSEKPGFTGPHSPYALPGRMLISYLGGKEGGLPAGLAEFDNDGTFIRKLDMPSEAPYGYDVAIHP